MHFHSADKPHGQVIHIGTQLELLIDEWLIAEKKDVSLQLHIPRKEEVVWTSDYPWEGSLSGYFTIFQDGSLIRLYYRGGQEDITCYAESQDGIYFTKPSLGLYEFNGSTQNNIVYRGPESTNFTPFLDQNPAAKPAEKYKAFGGEYFKGKGPGLIALCSPDGIHWQKMTDKPVKTLAEGWFDSQNVGFWDTVAHCYRSFTRTFTDPESGKVTYDMNQAAIRAIQSSTSPDFIQWSKPQLNQYGKVPPEHLYNNVTLPVPGAPHILLSFPMRLLQNRKKIMSHPELGVSDTLFMSSRDGLHWNRIFNQAWIRPGLDQRNWTDRSNMVAWGIIQTSSEEFSIYITEHYRWPTKSLRRYSLPCHRFASIQAKGEVGEWTTLSLTFSGDNLILNYNTSAAGYIQVEVQDSTGNPMPGYDLAASPELFGDELPGVLYWNNNLNLSSLKERTVRFRFVMQGADIDAISIAKTKGIISFSNTTLVNKKYEPVHSVAKS